MNITVFGTGYAGLSTGACLSDVGHNVVCVENDERMVFALQSGQMSINRAGMTAAVKRNQAAGRLRFTADVREGVSFGDLQFIAVDSGQCGRGAAAMQAVLSVARLIGEHMSDYKLVIDKTTGPVGTAEKVENEITRELARRGISTPFDVCSNPGSLDDRAVIEDCARSARIIVGADSARAREGMRECYAPFARTHDALMFMDVRAAELTKYAANAMLATRISFMNELANIADRLRVDIEQVRQGIGSDPRIGFQFIYPGLGFGGPCLPADVQELARSAAQVGYATELLNAVAAVNNRQPHTVFDKLEQVFNGDLSGRTIGLWGLSFKPDTDDMCEAPSRVLMEALWNAGARVQAFDPQAMPEAARIYGDRADLLLVENRDDAPRGADALVICTEWKQFRTVDFERLGSLLELPVVVDGRNLYDPGLVKAAGLLYFAVGRGDPLQPVI